MGRRAPPKMSTTPPKTGLPTTRRLHTPNFSTTPLHAEALSNIYAPISKNLFLSKPPSWKTDSVASPPKWKGEKHIFKDSAYYTLDPRGILPSKKLEARGLVEMPFQAPTTFPRLLIKKTEYRDGPIYPQFGDFRIDKLIRYEKVNVPASCSSIGTSWARQRIQGAGLVPEMGNILSNPSIRKEQFPAPFCELPDEQFRMWFVRNMEMLGWGEWEAGVEAERVLGRGEGVVVEEGVEEKEDDERCLRCPLAREIRVRLGEIERRKKERRQGKVQRAVERKSRCEEVRDDVSLSTMEEEPVKQGRYPVERRGKWSWIKKFFWWR
ncbi:uncharacterized protein J4E87_008008 [Alternaria ethzedia]|uniref:uncharacterized protein n=1 Tax=Alternaria ethzedia TaxID=181014 RepID=UPI0020C4D0CC|nr:uncharacterized protein J4E87_008008 [Alternaria ethzedia]KAI4618340.1 hypothetical protein J4E87_008008 [Alternaria ethzedia]